MAPIRFLRLAVAATALTSMGCAAALAAETVMSPQLTAPVQAPATQQPVSMQTASSQPTLTAPAVATQQVQTTTVTLTGKAPLPPDDTKAVSPKATAESSIDDPATFFTRADTDKNGLVSFSEFYAVAGTGFGPGDIRPSKKFAVLDSDEDNALTKDEIAANYGKPYYDQPKSLRWTPNGTDRD